MKRGYTAGQYREMLDADPPDRAARRGDQRLHRRLLRRDGGRFPGRRSDLVRDSCGSRTASSSSTAPGRGPRRPNCCADDVPEEVKRRRNNELLAIQNAISHEDNLPLVGRTRGDPGRGAEQDQPQAGAKTAPSSSSPAATPATGSWSSTVPASWSAGSSPSRSPRPTPSRSSAGSPDTILVTVHGPVK